MRRIRKGDRPPILAANFDAWTQEYLGFIERNERPPDHVKSRYRHPQIKTVVMAETHGKCAYCESHVTHVYPGDVEHVIAKAAKPELIFEWTNLTYACAACNGRKHDYYNEHQPLLNPVHDDPTQHLGFYGFFCVHRCNDQKGQLTVLLLELNRSDLLDRRRERLEKIVLLIDSCLALPLGPLREMLMEQIRQEAANDREYSVMVKQFVESRLAEQ
jgi:uncharacterized protein (TIGR02646 family)